MGMKEFTIGFGRTINLGDFNSARIDASVTIQVLAELRIEDQVEEAQEQLRALLEQTWKKQHKVPEGT